MRTITKLVDESLAGGWEMYKKISSGDLFSLPTYDIRTVYSRKELLKLIGEGFYLNDDAGNIALNILIKI